MPFADFDAGRCIWDIERYGVASIPDFLSDAMRFALLAELDQYHFKPQPVEVGAYRVRQAFSSVDSFPDGSLFLALRDPMEILFDGKFAGCFATRLRLTDLLVQRYQPGPLGISPHRDGESFVNLIALMVLEGKARFCISDDRGGTNAEVIPNAPGTLLLMRAPGFQGSNFRPFHFVDSITKRRTIFALRQKA